MRIALVNHRDWMEGGMDKVALTQLSELRALGHQAEMFAQHSPNNQPSPYQRFFPKDADRENYRLSLRRLIHLPADLAHTIHNPRAASQFGAFLDAFEPDLVHVHGLMRAFSPALYQQARLRHIPVVQTHHYVKLICPTGKLLRGETTYCREMPCLSGNTWSCVRHRCKNRSLPHSLMAALELGINRPQYVQQPDLHLSPSRYLQELLGRVGVPEQKLKLHPNFVDTRTFAPLDNQHQKSDFYLFVGRLAPEKGVDVLIDAFAPLKHLSLMLIGDGPSRAELTHRLQQEDLSHIHWLGVMDEMALIPWYQQAQATLIPSVWGEIFGLTILESFATGTPVIGARIGAIPELISHGETGMLVSPGNAESLREAVIEFHHLSQAQKRAMGLAARREAETRFTLKAHMSRLTQLYQEALASPAPVTV